MLRALQFALSPVPYAGEAFRALVDSRVEQGQNIFIDAIRGRGLTEIHKLSEAQAAFLIPSSYRLYEQVRLGDYEHTLMVLARLIAGGLVDDKSADVGRVARAARSLDMIGFPDLVCISCVDRAVLIHDKSVNRDEEGFGSHLGFFTPASLHDAVRETGRDYTLRSIRESIWGLSSRGLIVVGRNWFTGEDGTGYAITSLFDEVIEACANVVQTTKF